MNSCLATSSSSSSGAIIGGVIGGIVAICILAVGIFYYKKKMYKTFNNPVMPSSVVYNPDFNGGMGGVLFSATNRSTDCNAATFVSSNTG